MFTDLPSLLNFYKLHYLDTTPLIRPAPKRVEKVQGKYDFDGSDPDDLPFKKGEILTIVSKDEENWWTARNSLGQTGSIPVPYVAKVGRSTRKCPLTGTRKSSLLIGSKINDHFSHLFNTDFSVICPGDLEPKFGPNVEKSLQKYLVLSYLDNDTCL